MRQLTSLDAQFLNVESARTFGHVAFLGIYDPSTAPGGTLGAEDVKRLLEERLHLLPPLRWRLVEVPLGLDLPYWVDDPDFDLDFHVRESAIPPPGDDRQLAETVSRLFARPLDRGRPLWEFYVIHGLPEGRVALLTKIHHSAVDGISGNEIMAALLDPEPEGRVIDPPPDDHAPPPPVPRDREMLVRGLRGVPRQPLRALRSLPSTFTGFTDLPGVNALPGVPTLSHVYSRVRRTFGSDESTGRARGDQGPGPDDAVQRAGVGAPAVRVRLALARRGAPGPARVRHDGQRRRRDDLRRRRARLADGARRAAGRPAGRADPDVGAQARREGRLGQPDLDDDRPDPDQRAGSRRRGCAARTNCCAARRSATARCRPRC